MNNKIQFTFVCASLIMCFRADAQMHSKEDLLGAKAIISQIQKADFRKFHGVADKWPRLDFIDGYENRLDSGVVEVGIRNLLGSISDHVIQSRFAADAVQLKNNLDTLIALQQMMKSKNGYTNQVITSALDASIQAGIFALLNRAEPDLVGARAALKKYSGEDKVFDFHSWLSNAEPIDPWLQKQNEYIEEMPKFPSMPEIIFPLVKRGEKIQDKKSFPQLLNEVDLFQLGVRKYESNFIGSVVLPFWISYIESFGAPSDPIEIGTRTTGEASGTPDQPAPNQKPDALNALLGKFNEHPFTNSDPTYSQMYLYWERYTSKEGVREIADSISR